MDASTFRRARPPRVARAVASALLAVAVFACVAPPQAGAVGPSVTLTASPLTPVAGQEVTFTAAGVPETGAELSSYRWDLDNDGSYELNTGLDPTARATFPTPGSYTVTVQMRDSWANRVATARTVVVSGRAPVASFAFSPASPAANEPVLFVSTSSDSDGVIADLAWDLNGDGVFDNGAGSSASRSFGAAGTYVVSLRATDDEGHVSFASQTISVRALPFGALPGGALRLLNPFPVVRFSGSLTRRGARLKKVVVDAPAGATVAVRCSGRSCPYRTRKSVVSRNGASLRLPQLERRLRAGVKIRIYVTSPGTIGKYTSFRIRRGRPPHRTDRCVAYGSSRPVSCRG